jgi:hypothetical protein
MHQVFPWNGDYLLQKKLHFTTVKMSRAFGFMIIMAKLVFFGNLLRKEWVFLQTL